MSRLKRHMELIERMMGVLLILVGLALLTGGFSVVFLWLLEPFPACLWLTLGSAALLLPEIHASLAARANGRQDGHDPHRNQVRRRRVFYIPGYDPIHPRRYRELYRQRRRGAGEDFGLQHRTETRRQPATPMAGMSRVRSTARRSWRISTCWSGPTSCARVWPTPFRAPTAQLVRTAWTYISTGALWRLMRLRKGPVIAALYPVGMLLLQLALAVGLGALVRAGLARGIDALVPICGRALAALWRWRRAWVAAVAALRWFKARDNKLFAYYLMHDYAYSRAIARGLSRPSWKRGWRTSRDAIAGRADRRTWTRCWWSAIRRARIWRCRSWPI